MKYFAFYCSEDGFYLEDFDSMEELSEFLSYRLDMEMYDHTLDENETVERGRIICLKGEYIKPKPAEKITVWKE